MIKIMLQAGRYFGIVFSIGFALGTVRMLLLVPRLGERSAELLEMPFMVIASFLAAYWLFAAPRKTSNSSSRWSFSSWQCFAIGMMALGMLLLAEYLLVIFARGQSLGEYVAGRDPMSGTLYLFSLILFGLFPFLVGVWKIKFSQRSTKTHTA